METKTITTPPTTQLRPNLTTHPLYKQTPNKSNKIAPNHIYNHKSAHTFFVQHMRKS